MTSIPADCFVINRDILRVAEAFDILARLPVIAEPEGVPLEQSAGRVLAYDVTARFALPPFDHAAVDGYALRFADLGTSGGRLPVVGRVAAGEAAPRLPAGAAIRVFTGAPVPDEADTVVMQEDVRIETGETLLLAPGRAKPGGNIRRAGEEIAAGSVALPAGRRIGPVEIALAASFGLSKLVVRRPLRAALLSTGNELAETGETLGPAQRYDSNRPLLAALLRRLGCRVTDFGIVRDEPAALVQAFKAARANADLVVASGGVSAGEEDHVRAAIGALGQVNAWTMALKPGRAIAMGMIAGVPVIGLPGNPVAAFNACLHVLRPAVLALSGAQVTPLQPLPLRAAFRHRKRAGRLEALRVQVAPDADGVLAAHLFGGESSGWLTSLTEGHGLALIGEDEGDIEPGMTIGYLPFAGLF